MPFVTGPEGRFRPGLWRLLGGLLAASAIPSFLVSALFLSSDFFWMIFWLGCLSICTVYVPLIFCWLPSRRPLLVSVVIGAVSAPGPLTAALGVVMLLNGSPAALPFLAFALAITMTLGAIGGFVFWLCVLWRNPDVAAQEELSA
jgi:hypothetical protein